MPGSEAKRRPIILWSWHLSPDKASGGNPPGDSRQPSSQSDLNKLSGLEDFWTLSGDWGPLEDMMEYAFQKAPSSHSMCSRADSSEATAPGWNKGRPAQGGQFAEREKCLGEKSQGLNLNQTSSGKVESLLFFS